MRSTEGTTPALGDTDEALMRLALEAAAQAEAIGEVPVGAVVTIDGRVIATAHNERETGCDPLAHAEILALARAAKALGRWRLQDATLYVTLEPCPMCAGALVNARVKRLVYGADDPKAGAVRSLYRILDDQRLNHRVDVTRGVLVDACGGALKSFFRRRRERDSNPR